LAASNYKESPVNAQRPIYRLNCKPLTIPPDQAEALTRKIVEADAAVKGYMQSPALFIARPPISFPSPWKERSCFLCDRFLCLRHSGQAALRARKRFPSRARDGRTMTLRTHDYLKKNRAPEPKAK